MTMKSRLLIFSADGKIMITASKDSTVIIWKTQNFQSVDTISIKYLSQISSASISPDGQSIVTTFEDRSSAEIRSLNTPYENIITFNGKQKAAVYSPLGNWILSISTEEGRAMLWDARTGEAEKASNVLATISLKQILIAMKRK